MTTPGDTNQDAGQPGTTTAPNPNTAAAPPTGPQIDPGAVLVLHEAFTAAATGAGFDADRVTEQVLRGRLLSPDTWTTLRALAIEGTELNRTQDQLWDAVDMGAITGHLRAVADQIPTPSAEDAAARDAAARASADMVFGAMDPRGVRMIAVLVAPPPAALYAAQFPMELNEDDLRTISGLRRGVQARITSEDEPYDELPYEEVTQRALRVIDSVCNTANLAVSPVDTAWQVATSDSTPMHTAVRLRQFADLIDRHLPNPDIQRVRFGTYDQGRTLADHLRAVDAEIMVQASRPATLAGARVDRLFSGLTTVLNLPRTAGAAATATSDRAVKVAPGASAQAARGGVQTVEEERRAAVLTTELADWPAIDDAEVRRVVGSGPVPDYLRVEEQLRTNADTLAQDIVDRAMAAHRSGSGVDPATVEEFAVASCTDAGLPWDFDVAATERLTLRAEQLRVQAGGGQTVVDGLDPARARVVASQLEHIVERVGMIQGFTPRSATQISVSAALAAGQAQPRPGPAESRRSTTDDPIFQGLVESAAAHNASIGTEMSDADEPDWLDDPSLDPAEALLGSAIHAPDALNDLSKILKADNFPREGFTPSRRSVLGQVYETLQGLHQDGQLKDCTSLGSETERMNAAHANQRRVARALRDAEYIPVGFTNPAKIIGRLTEAAPLQASPLHHAYDPRAQVRMGRMVLEDSVFRRVAEAGGTARRLTTHIFARLNPERAARRARAMLTSLDDMSHRLALATGEASTDVGLERLRDLVENSPDSAAPVLSGRLPRPMVRRAEELLLTAALQRNGAVLQFEPDDFAKREHANTWRAIKHLQANNHPITSTTVFHAIRQLPEPHRHHALSKRQLMTLEDRPEPAPGKIMRSIRTLATATLQRANAQATALAAKVGNARDIPAQAVLGFAMREHAALARQATAVAALHQQRRSGSRT
jgi:DnaB-like helicase N terminal domain